MKQQFTPLAQSRAGYYCKGCPVQFVRVELLRMEENGATVVTFTFKNVHKRVLTSCVVHFRCKNKYGEVLVEDDFTYENLNVGEGQAFGCDDAVFVCDEPIGSVDVNVSLICYEHGTPRDVATLEKVPLPALRPLPEQAVKALNASLRIDSAHYIPNEAADGWQCTCGEFNYNAGAGYTGCSACGADRAMLFAALRAMQTPRRAFEQQAVAASAPAPSTVPPQAPHAPSGAPRAQDYYQKAQMGEGTQQPAFAAQKPSVTEILRHIPADGVAAQPAVSIMSDKTARAIMQYAPLVTGALSVLYVLGALLISQLR